MISSYLMTYIKAALLVEDVTTVFTLPEFGPGVDVQVSRQDGSQLERLPAELAHMGPRHAVTALHVGLQAALISSHITTPL